MPVKSANSRASSRKQTKKSARMLKSPNGLTKIFSQIKYKKEPIGEGVWGRVYQACKSDDYGECTVAVKHLNSKEAVNQPGYFTLPAYRDIALYKYLGQYVLFGNQPIVPRLYGWDVQPCQHTSSMCKGEICSHPKCHTYRFATEKFDGNVEHLINVWTHRIFPERDKTTCIVITLSVLQRMFELAIVLGLLGIIHGDLKPDQFLYRSKPTLTICVIDFGFAGAIPSVRDHIQKLFSSSSSSSSNQMIGKSVTDAVMGWPSGDSWPFGKLKHDDVYIETRDEAILFNVWNLYLWFASNPTIVYDDINEHRYGMFGGITGLTKEMHRLKFAQKFFPNPDGWSALMQEVRKQNAQQRLASPVDNQMDLTLNYQDLVLTVQGQ